jgi:predicted PurR-regulated permease PerM|uniref:AI-2E family transporter n=1 Tax=Desulfobacca acetoxidans TaxID=60893 RepID=A0A7C3SIK9_9BACT
MEKPDISPQPETKTRAPGPEPREPVVPSPEWQAFPTQFARLFFGAITLLVLYYSYAIIKPYLIDIFLAFVLFITVKPLYQGLTRIFFGRKILASGVTCLILALFILVPLLTMVSIVANQALEFSGTIKEGLKSDQLWQWIDAKSNLIASYLKSLNLPLPPEQIKLEDVIKTVLIRASEFIYSNAIGLLRGFAMFFMDMLLVLMVAFFMFLQGDDFIEEVKKLSPLDAAHNEAILQEMEATIKATMWSTVVVAIVQGALGGLGFFAVGLPQPAFWGTVMIPASVIPVVGAAIIWVPGVIYLFIQGQTMKAIGLLIYFVVIVGSVDNFLRPVLTKGSRSTPAIFILFAILGGISYFGIAGFILGPLILSFLLSLLQIYQKTFLAAAPAAAATGPSKTERPTAVSGDGP